MKTAYRVSNSGSGGIPLLCIHGVGSNMHSWDQVIPSLPNDRPLVSYDLRGHGESEKPVGPYSIDDFISDAVALMDQIGIAVFDVVGFSLGGLIAQGLALEVPDRIRRLVVIGAVANRSVEERARVEERYRELAAEGPVAIAERSVERWYTPDYLAEFPEVRELTIQEMAGLDPDAYTAAYKVLAATDFADSLSKILAPTLAIAGEGDVGSPPHMSQHIAEAVADGRFVIIEGVKHNMLSAATEVVAKEIALHLT